MYKICINIVTKFSTIDESLSNKLGYFITNILWIILFLITPIILVVINNPISNYISMTFSVLIILLCILQFIVGVFGDKELVTEEGFLNMVSKAEFKNTILGAFVWIVFIISNYAVLYTAINNQYPSIHYLVNNRSIPIIDFEYYSVVTIVTLGYGDIVPISWFAKLLCITEILVGVLVFILSFGIILSGYVNSINRGETKKEN